MCKQSISTERGQAKHTTLGLKGGSTSLLSKAGQSIILKKGCKRMSPTIPSLRVGSLSKNCKKPEIIDQRCFIVFQCFQLPVGCFRCDIDPLNQVLGLLVDPARVMGSIHADGLEQLILIISVERWLTNQHFIQQHSEWPPVNGEGVFLSQQDLRG